MPASAKFAPDPRRRALIAKVKVAQKELGLVDDDYRAVLHQVTGKTSAADCSEAELVRVVERFRSRGFKPKVAPGRPAKPKPADNPMARKARAMWISLYQLAVVRNPAEKALEAFAAQQLGCERMQWADQSRAYKLIEALKAMGDRAGWDQDMTAIPAEHRVHALRVRLVEAILANLKRLGQAPRHWSIEDAAHHLCRTDRSRGAVSWATSELDAICNALGARLRAAKGMRDDQFEQRGEQP